MGVTYYEISHSRNLGASPVHAFPVPFCLLLVFIFLFNMIILPAQNKFVLL